MECRIYDTSLTPVAVLYSWVSMDWKEGYYDVGAFTLELVKQSDTLDYIRLDYYCGIPQSDTLMVIKSIQSKNGKIIATGFSALYVLKDRISTEEISNTAAESAMRGLVSGMTAFPCVSLGEEAEIEDIFEGSISKKDVLEYITTIAEACDIGVRLRHDKTAPALLFECYKPTAASLRCYSEYGNLGETEYVVSTADYKNVVTVIGAEATVTAGDDTLTGADRREMLLDKSSESRKTEDGETDAQYRQRLEDMGTAELVKSASILKVTASIDDPAVALGKIASCRFTDLGISANIRITGIEILSQNNRLEVSYSLGTPIIKRRQA